MQNTFSQSGNDSKWFLKKIIFQNRYVALETPSRPPPLHGKNHLKFPFWSLEPFPKGLSFGHMFVISHYVFALPQWYIRLKNNSDFLKLDNKWNKNKLRSWCWRKLTRMVCLQRGNTHCLVDIGGDVTNAGQTNEQQGKIGLVSQCTMLLSQCKWVS